MGLVEAMACRDDVRALLGKLRSVDDSAIVRAIEIILPFARAVRERAIRQGQLTFDALLSLTRELLVRDPAVRRDLGKRFRLILVDEFQDTDPLQYEIVLLLSEDSRTEPSKDAFDTSLAPGKLFVVGDPKQSIYGFRGADIRACQRAIRHVALCGGLECSLTTTWRAVPEIVEPLDRLFRQVFERRTEEKPDLHPPYEGMQSGRERAGDGARVQVWTVPPEQKTKAEQARRNEAMAIAAWIAQKWMSGGEAEGRRYRHVALLFRSFTQSHLYVGAMRRWNIPFALERSRNLLEDPEVQQLWAVLCALARPADGPAVLGVLRSALGAVPDAELAEYATNGNPSWCYTEASPDPERSPALARTFDWLRSWHDRLGQTPTDRFITELVEESPLLPVHATAADGRTRVATLRGVTARIASLARAEPTWPLLRVLEAFEAVVSGGSATLGETGAEAAADAVQLLTFHAAKGLEFPVVFLPDLARSLEDSSGPRARETEVGLLEEPEGRWVRVGGLESALSVLEKEQEKERDAAEVRRLFYVACTRAVEHLVFVHAPRTTGAGPAWIDLLAPWGYAEGIAHGKPLPEESAVVHQIVPPGEPEGTEPTESYRHDWQAALGRAEEAAKRARTAARPPFRRPSGLREEEEAREELSGSDEGPPPPATAGDRMALAVGTAVHDALERWNFVDPERIGELASAAAAHAARLKGLDRDRVEEATLEVIERFQKTALAHELASVEIIGREVPFLLQENGESWSGTIDLIYRSSEGALVVADYKTDRDAPEEAPERYAAQLAIYARAVARAFPDEPEPLRELLYVREGKRFRC
jgi:ATP-dependent helicase/nuclease subunit A